MNAEDLADHLLNLADGKGRFVVAIAGPPGSGKSTLADELCAIINDRRGAGTAAIVPMDGFHLDNDTLERMGMRQRKGAPETFNGAGFVAMMEAIRANKGDVSVPEFDRSIDATVERGRTVSSSARIILAEGNYLLLNSEPWSQLGRCFDYSILVNPGLKILEARLIARWMAHGHDQRSARERTRSNDIPNAKAVISHSREPDLSITGLNHSFAPT
jgi:pantothenate kinase